MVTNPDGHIPGTPPAPSHGPHAIAPVERGAMIGLAEWFVARWGAGETARSDFVRLAADAWDDAAEAADADRRPAMSGAAFRRLTGMEG